MPSVQHTRMLKLGGEQRKLRGHGENLRITYSGEHCNEVSEPRLLRECWEYMLQYVVGARQGNTPHHGGSLMHPGMCCRADDSIQNCQMMKVL